MAFVVIGFQQVVANMFVISAVIFAGHLTWMDLAKILFLSLSEM